MTRKKTETAQSVHEIDMILPRAWDDMDEEMKRQWLKDNLKKTEILLVILDELGVDFEYATTERHTGQLRKDHVLEIWGHVHEGDHGD